MMTDTNTEVPSVEATSASKAEESAEKSEPCETTARHTETPLSVGAAVADPASAKRDEASVEPVKENSSTPAETEKTNTHATEEGTTVSQAATPVEASGATKDAAPTKTPFDEFDAKLPEILKEVGHNEMWGVKLISPASSHIPTGIVIQKFLNANDGDLTKAIEQFTEALKFRKEKNPLDLVTKTFNANKFSDLGAVTVYSVKDSPVPEVFTWNLYGNVKGKMDEVFVPLDESVHHLALSTM